MLGSYPDLYWRSQIVPALLVEVGISVFIKPNIESYFAKNGLAG